MIILFIWKLIWIKCQIMYIKKFHQLYWKDPNRTTTNTKNTFLILYGMKKWFVSGSEKVSNSILCAGPIRDSKMPFLKTNTSPPRQRSSYQVQEFQNFGVLFLLHLQYQDLRKFLWITQSTTALVDLRQAYENYRWKQ